MHNSLRDRSFAWRLLGPTLLIVALIALLASAPSLLAQTPKEQPSPTKDQPFNPRDVSGVWNTGRGGPGVAQMVPNDVAMTPWAQALCNSEDGCKGNNGTGDPYRLCEPLGPTRWVNFIHPFEIIQIPGRVLIFYEIGHEWRTIYTDGRPLPKVDDLVYGPTYYGYSVGHLDGNDLVVDTIGINERTWLDDRGHPYSNQMHLTERYHRADHDTLMVTFSFDDPKAYTKPFSWGPKPFQLKAGQQWEVQESDCLLSEQRGFDQNLTKDLIAPKAK